MTNDSHKARLATLVQELSVIHEKVTLASGRESDFYVDMRRSTLHHEAAPLIGHVMLDLLEESGFAVGEEYVAVGGLTMGADPVATAMMHAAASGSHRMIERTGTAVIAGHLLPNTQAPALPNRAHSTGVSAHPCKRPRRSAAPARSRTP